MSAATVTPQFAAPQGSMMPCGPWPANLQPEEPVFCFSASRTEGEAQQFLRRFPGTRQLMP
jgi:hypothetical protein